MTSCSFIGKESATLYNNLMSSVAPITFIYAVIFICSLMLIIIYKALLGKNIDKKGLIVLVSIAIINLGYFLLSFSKSVDLAIFANRLSYFGSVTLLVFMYMIVNEFCNVKNNKILDNIIKIVSLLALLLSVTGGSSLKLYYETVDIRIVDNVTYLVKTYSPYHFLYGIYVFLMYIIMVTTVITSTIKKRVKSSINPTILLLLVTENMAVWYIEKLLSIQMELLSVSYITTGAIFILLFKNNNEYSKLDQPTIQFKETTTIDQIIKNWEEKYMLTKRELEVLQCLINNMPRSKIAEQLFVSEHTVKKHTAHIYEKLQIKSRNDLLHKLNEEIAH